MKKSNQEIKQELEAIKNTLELFDAGASLDEIKKASGLDIELRTLQRRLVTLQEQGDRIQERISTSASVSSF